MKVGIFHYKFGGNDGVSLEIEKRIKLLKKQHCEVVLIGGELLKDYGCVTYELAEFNINLKENVEFLQKQIKDKDYDVEHFNTVYPIQKLSIFRKLHRIFEVEKFDCIIVHNVFSLPLTFPAADALSSLVQELGIPTICVHHDFYFERDYFLNTTNPHIREALKNIIPDRDGTHHEVINSNAYRKLKDKHNVDSEVLGDFWDFEQEMPQIDDFNKDFNKDFGIRKKDFVILQATRIVPRKAIENTIVFANKLQKKLRQEDKHAKEKPRNVIIFLSNYPELIDSLEYADKLKMFAKEHDIRLIFGHERIENERRVKSDGSKVYSFWDPYLFCDMIAYTSIQEGFGNQFLEACYFQKLLLLFEYSVFKEDIGPKGYQYISLGDTYNHDNGFNLVADKKIELAVKHVMNLMKYPHFIEAMAKMNFETAKKHHHITKLEDVLKKKLAEVSQTVHQV